MKVCAKVEVIEIDGDEIKRNRPEIEVTRHWNSCNWVVNLRFPDCKKIYAVRAGELKAAIEVCTKDVVY